MFFPRSSTSGHTSVTVLPNSIKLQYTAGLYWDFLRRHLLYVDRTLKQIHEINFKDDQSAYITTGNQSLLTYTHLLTTFQTCTVKNKHL